MAGKEITEISLWQKYTLSVLESRKSYQWMLCENRQV